RSASRGSHANVLPRERTGHTILTGGGDIESDPVVVHRRDVHRRAARDIVDVVPGRTTSRKTGNQYGGLRATGVEDKAAGSIENDRSNPCVTAGRFIVDGAGQTRVSVVGGGGRNGHSVRGVFADAHA